MTLRHIATQRKLHLYHLEIEQGLNEGMIAEALLLIETVQKPPQTTILCLFEIYLTMISTV
jgi:hypothetical protein